VPNDGRHRRHLFRSLEGVGERLEKGTPLAEAVEGCENAKGADQVVVGDTLSGRERRLDFRYDDRSISLAESFARKLAIIDGRDPCSLAIRAGCGLGSSERLVSTTEPIRRPRPLRRRRNHALKMLKMNERRRAVTEKSQGNPAGEELAFGRFSSGLEAM